MKVFALNSTLTRKNQFQTHMTFFFLWDIFSHLYISLENNNNKKNKKMNGCFFCPMKLQRRMTGASKEIQEQHESSPYNVCINYIFPLKPYISLV